MVVAVSLGFLYRIIMPVERHLEEQEYQMKVFTEFEVDVYKSPSPGAPVFGTFEGGSVLYVMAEASLEKGDSLRADDSLMLGDSLEADDSQMAGDSLRANDSLKAKSLEAGVSFTPEDAVSGRLLYLVRPFTVSGLDSVWVDAADVLVYTKEAYRRWQYEEEIRKYGFDEEDAQK